MRYSRHQRIAIAVVGIATAVSGFHSHKLGGFQEYKPSIFTIDQRGTSISGRVRKPHRSSTSALLLSKSYTEILNVPAVYGLTADGEPCKNCMKQERFCWQHRWQATKNRSLLSNEKSADANSGILGLRECVIALALTLISMDVVKHRLLLRSVLFVASAMHPSHLKNVASVALGQSTTGITVKMQILTAALASMSIKRVGGVTLGSPLILGLILGRYLCQRGLKTTELLQSVEDSVRQVRYLCQSSSTFNKSIPNPSNHVATVLPNYVNTERRLVLKKPSSSCKPWSQLMAKAYATGAYSGDESSDVSSAEVSSKKKTRRVVLSVVSAACVLAIVGLARRDFLLTVLDTWREKYSAARLRDKIVPILDNLNDSGYKGMVAYTFGLLLWTMTVGVTTPIETAAGIAFGVKKGIICSAIGKIGGAVSSFLLGRHLLFDYVNEKLKDNELLGLVEESIQEHPLRVSLLIRFSPLPEVAKNFGLSLLKVRIGWFVTASLLHGLPFSCLWTCLGAETASVMRGGDPSKTLKVLMTGVSWFGKLLIHAVISILPFLSISNSHAFILQAFYHLL